MRFVYPSDPFNKKLPDEAYADEFLAAQEAGNDCSLFSAEDFEIGEFKPRPTLVAGEDVIYRGWMLPPSVYGRLVEAILRIPAKPVHDSGVMPVQRSAAWGSSVPADAGPRSGRLFFTWSWSNRQRAPIVWPAWNLLSG